MKILVIVVLAATSVAASELKLVSHGNSAFSDKEVSGFANLSSDGVIDLHDVAQRITDSLISHDFVFARVDSVVRRVNNSRILDVYVDEGGLAIVNVVRWHGDTLRVSPEAAKRARIRPDTDFRWDNVEADAEMLLDYFDASGYPFARVEIEHIGLDAIRRSIDVWLKLTSGPFITIDFLRLSGLRNTSQRFLERQTRMRMGEPFNVRHIESARNSLARLEFVKSVSDAAIVVNLAGQTGVQFRIEEGPASRVDAVAGYLPSNGKQDAVVSGLVNLDFVNLFGSGRKAHIYWNRPDNSIQAIELSYKEPWILGQPVSIRGDFGQRIEDTLYVQQKAALRGELQASPSFLIWGGFQIETTIADSAARELLGVSRANSILALSGLEFATFDNLTNPRTGVRFSTSIESGKRHHAEATTANPAGSYMVSRVGISSEFAFTIVGYWIGFVGGHAEALDSEEPVISTPNLLRIGGARTLRGYREEQFLGTRTGWGTAELRYWLGTASRVFAFTDLGAVYRPVMDSDRSASSTTYHGAGGVGVRIESALGVWGVDYAVGQDDRILNGKVHVSLLSDF